MKRNTEIHNFLYSRFGTYSTDLAVKAGMDLEMPGPPRWRTPLLMHQSLSSQKISVDDIDRLTLDMLTFVQRLARRNPEVVYGDGIERSRDTPEGRAFCRKLFSECIVLLKNEHNVLPIRKDKVKKIAVIGPNAKGTVISGGGSAALKPTYVVTPFDGVANHASKNNTVEYAVGCYGTLHFLLEYPET